MYLPLVGAPLELALLDRWPAHMNEGHLAVVVDASSTRAVAGCGDFVWELFVCAEGEVDQCHAPREVLDFQLVALE